MIDKIIILIILTICFYLLNNYLENNSNIKKINNFEYFDNNISDKTIWMYWETLPNKKKPGYIDLCIESVKHNCGNCFNVIVLDNNNIYDYLPEIKNMNLSKLNLPQKVDYYRYLQRYEYLGQHHFNLLLQQNSSLLRSL